ncbi:hypothetical protein JOB18_050047, partial [Solea senegalensis]
VSDNLMEPTLQEYSASSLLCDLLSSEQDETLTMKDFEASLSAHAFVEPKDLSSVCCWLWQPAVRGAQGESGGQVKAGPAADKDWSQRSLTPNEW